jgi:hypothetical protein
MRPALKGNLARHGHKLLGVALLGATAAGSIAFANSRNLIEFPPIVAASGLSDIGDSGYPVRIPLREAGPFRIDLALLPPVNNQGEPATLPKTEKDGESPAEGNGRTDTPRVSDSGGEPKASQPPADGILAAGGGSPKFMRLEFSLASLQGNADPIDIQKVVRTQGADRGSVKLRIANDARILINSSDLISVIGDELSAEEIASLSASQPANGFTDFDTLRAAGLDVRYDPVHDRLLIATGSPKA